ncbi:MAG: PilZ domain-containing protein [Gammaproteobacteria bacterium]|nr:PilZ domain-containing protein [Gammaproteobacteria bacterium]MDH3508413.1 PilZ domain-containing protein [Gammaproteobacteria bacterium]
MPSFSKRSEAFGATGGRKERRNPYRTTDGIDDIRVSMAVPERAPIEGTLVDLSAAGAAVLMRRASTEDLAALAVGADVCMTFEVSGIDPISGILAVVRNVRETDDGCVFGLEIIEWQTPHSQLPARVFSAFNRRRHYRLEFMEESAPEVEVQPLPEGAPSAARLGDLSVSGCLLFFDTEHAPTPQSALRLEFELPGIDFRFSFHGTVRNVSVSKRSARCGIEFNARRSGNFMAQEQQLSHFIVKRQQELRALK